MTHVKLPTRVDFLSSGDLAKDDQFIVELPEMQSRIRNGHCPNGCGPFLFVENGTMFCEHCEFAVVKVVLGLFGGG